VSSTTEVSWQAGPFQAEESARGQRVAHLQRSSGWASSSDDPVQARLSIAGLLAAQPIVSRHSEKDTRPSPTNLHKLQAAVASHTLPPCRARSQDYRQQFASESTPTPSALSFSRGSHPQQFLEVRAVRPLCSCRVARQSASLYRMSDCKSMQRGVKFLIQSNVQIKGRAKP